MSIFFDQIEMINVEVTIFLCNVLLIIIIVAAYVKLSLMVKNQGTQIQVLLKHDRERFSTKEAMAPALRYGGAASASSIGNRLMPEGRVQELTREPLALNFPRGNVSVDYMLGKRDDSIGGEQIDKQTTFDDAVDSALVVSDEEKIKAGATSIAATDFIDNSMPDTSQLPAEVQTGVVDPKEAYGCGGNTRVCPSFLSNGSFRVDNQLQSNGNSTSKDGFRVRKTAGK